MICLDNSEWMRNGDCGPTRFEAQKETVELIANTKVNDNAETIVGILSMAGNRIDVNISPCRDMGAIMTAITKEVKVGGKSNFTGSLKTAQLALKNRINKSQRQRIVMFVGSPIQDDNEELVKVGKNMKKNNVAVDVINFGAEAQENAEKLDAFLSAVNSSDNSHLLNVPPGPHILSDLVVTSSILSPDHVGGAATATPAGGISVPGIGAVDPNQDPELAMAIQQSMEEQRRRIAEEKKTAEKPQAPPKVNPSPPSDDAMDEDEELQRALNLSMGAQKDDDHPMTGANVSTSTSTSTGTSSSTDSDIREALQDPDFMSSLLNSVPGVDQNELALDDILKELTDPNASKDNSKDNSKDTKKDPKDPNSGGPKDKGSSSKS